MVRLVLMRHGWSQWNKENRFTGWHDVPLNSEGEAQADEGGALLKAEGITFDVAYTSVLKRAIDTCYRALHAAGMTNTPVTFHWQLNERHYGALTGLNKAETMQKYGEAQVFAWRRSLATRPPLLDAAALVAQAREPHLIFIPEAAAVAGESLLDCMSRTIPWFQSVVEPQLRQGKNVFIAASHNSLRALCKYLDKMPDEAIAEFNIPFGAPRVYEMDETLTVHSVRYLGDPIELERRRALATTARPTA